MQFVLQNSERPWEKEKVPEPRIPAPLRFAPFAPLCPAPFCPAEGLRLCGVGGGSAILRVAGTASATKYTHPAGFSGFTVDGSGFRV